jgi:sulfate adenylyltransferase
VVEILQEYYQNLDDKVEIKLHGAATGDIKK